MLEEVLGMRDLNLHTGGRKKEANINYATIQDASYVGGNLSHDETPRL